MPGPRDKAFRELEGAGLVGTGRANGTRANAGRALQDPALAEARSLVAAARAAGMSPEAVQGLATVSW